MSNQEIRYLIKNELEYLKSLSPQSVHIHKYIYKKYKNIIDNYSKAESFTKFQEKMFCYMFQVKSRPVCIECGNSVKFDSYLTGYQKYCSNKCVGKNNGPKVKSFKTVFKKFITTHNNFYKYDESTYVNAHTKMRIIFPIHGEFYQTPYVHYNGAGCNKCGNKRMGDKQTLSYRTQLKSFRKIHGFFYNYDKTTYINDSTKMKIICPIHGEFWQSPELHKTGSGCSLCVCSTTGEKLIFEFLHINKLKFIYQKRFKDCRYDYPLPFDFYLPNHNICIEYDGIQHYKHIKHFHPSLNDFKIQQSKDIIKNNYCYVNKIKIIRIPYTEKNNINNILKNVIK